MFKNLTYEFKIRWMLVVSVFAGFVSYSLFIQKTVATANECDVLQKRMALAVNAPSEIERIDTELAKLNSIVGSGKRLETPVREDLLSLLTNFGQNHSIVLREFPPTLFKQDNDLLVETNMFTVEGSFTKLLALVYELEQKKKIGKVSSVIYQTKKDNATNRLVLTATIYLQNIKKQES